MKNRIMIGSAFIIAAVTVLLFGKFNVILSVVLMLIGFSAFFIKARSNGVLDDLSDETSYITVKICRIVSIAMTVLNLVLCIAYAPGFVVFAVAVPLCYWIYYRNCLVDKTDDCCHYPFVPLLVNIPYKIILSFMSLFVAQFSAEYPADFNLTAQIVAVLTLAGTLLFFAASVMLYHGVVRETVKKVVAVSVVLSAMGYLIVMMNIQAWIVIIFLPDIVLSAVACSYFWLVKVDTYYNSK